MDLAEFPSVVLNRGKSRPSKSRRGVAAAEFALVLPALLLLILGIIEFGRGMQVQQMLTNGAREAARRAVLPSTTDSEVYNTIDTYMRNTGIIGHSRQISPSLAGAQSDDLITVTVSVPYNRVALLHAGWLRGLTLTASVVMRKE